MHLDINGLIKDLLFIIGVGLTVGIGSIFLITWAIQKWHKK